MACLGVLLAIWGGYGQSAIVISPVSAQQPFVSQSVRPEAAATIIYQRLTYLPQENQYVAQETGQIAADNTLVTRLIRYHQDLKKRPTRFRLDWKLTLADYLGVNELMNLERYPGYSTLSSNPMENDVKAIRTLNRRQREELVDLLVSLYQPKKESSATPTTPSEPESSPESTPSKPTLSKPGDAQLLMP